MSHSCVQVYLHIIFSTKDRRPLIPKEIENRLYGYISGISNRNNAHIIQIGGTEDHIHILLKFNPSITLGTLVKELKSYSSGWIKKQGHIDFAWQEGYGAFSCSINHVDRIIEYIKNQKEHHKKYSFKEELDRICKLWRIERMVWCYDDEQNKEEKIA